MAFVLVEVISAVVLLAVVIVAPLTTCLLASADRVVRACERTADLRQSPLNRPVASLGARPMVTSLRWTSGPCAVADVAGLTT